MRVLQGKSALVTGAASGIGRAIALGLAREKVHLYLLDVDEAGLANIADEISALGGAVSVLNCDLQQPEQISAAVARIVAAGGVDLVVNNAGVAHYGPTHEMDESQWERVLSINLLAPLQIIRELLPSLLGRPEAHIVNMGSMFGLVAGPRAAAYSLSKFALQGLSESLRAEYGRSGLGVTAVCPGFVSTGLFNAAERAGSSPLPKYTNSRLMTTPEQIADCTIAAIRHNRPLVVITPLARLLWFCKRLAPSLFLRLFTARHKPTPQVSENPPGLSPALFPGRFPVSARAIPPVYEVHCFRTTRAEVSVIR